MQNRFLSFVLVVGLVCVPAVPNAKPPIVGKYPDLNFQPPKPERAVLSNGVVVYLMEDHELPLFRLDLDMKISPAQVPENKIGAKIMLGTVWRSGGTKKRSTDALNEELEALPAKVETSVGEETASITLSCLSKDKDKGLAIFKDVLFNPKFDSKRLALAKAKQLEALRRKNDNPTSISRRAFRDVVYGPKHIYAYNPLPDVIKKAKRKDFQVLHKTFVVPDHAMAVVWGDFEKDKILADLETLFQGWEKKNHPLPEYDYNKLDTMEGTTFFVQKDGFSQTRMYVGNIGISRHSPDKFALAVANNILGHGGASRLFAEIRSRLGLAYVVGSFYTNPAGPGLIGAACQTKGQSSKDALNAMNKELDKFIAKPPTAEELKLAKDSIINAFIFQFESTSNIVNQQASLEFFGYPKDYLETYTQKIKAVTAKRVLEVAKKYYAKENRKIVMVGDKSKLGEQFEAFEVVEKIRLSLLIRST